MQLPQSHRMFPQYLSRERAGWSLVELATPDLDLQKQVEQATREERGRLAESEAGSRTDRSVCSGQPRGLQPTGKFCCRFAAFREPNVNE